MKDRKPVLQCSLEPDLKEFFDKLGKESQSSAYWVRLALIEFGKAHSWNTEKVIKEHYQI